MRSSFRIGKTILKKSVLTVLTMLLMITALFSQINGTTCVTPGSTYSYGLQSGTWSYSPPITSMIWSVTNGVITSSSSGTPLPSINVQWNTGITTGQVRVTTTNPSGSYSLNVSVPSAPLTPGSLTSTPNPPLPINYNAAPAAITFSAPGGGGCGTSVYSYDWQKSQDNINFTSMGVSTATITLTPILNNTYYRRRVFESTSGSFAYTVSVFAEVITQPGTISPAAYTINTNTSPGQLTGSTPLGGTGTYTYQWYQSVDGGANWSAITTNGTSQNYFPPALTVSTRYRRDVTSGGSTVFSISIITISSTPIFGIFPPTYVTGDANIDMLWIKATTYDPLGYVISEGKNFYDNAGKLLQTQAKVKHRKDGSASTVYTHVMASQPIYDVYGQPAASTLPAPIDYADFNYIPDFIQAGDGSNYTYKNFDLYNPNGTATDKTNIPDPVGGKTTVGKLGWYYSSNNTWEPYTPTTDYPYSRQTYYKDGTGSVKKTGSTGEAFKMGSGHDASSYTVAVSGELAHYITVRNKFFPATQAGSLPTSLQGKAIQSVSRDANGKEGIGISDLSGRVLMTARPGSDWTANNSISIANIPSTYTQEISCVTGTSISLQSFTGGTNVNIYLVSATGAITLPYSGAAAGVPLNSSFGSGTLTIVSDAVFSANYTSGGTAYSSGSRSNPGGSIQSIGYFKILGDNTTVTITGSYTLYDMNTELATSLTAGKLNRGYYKITGSSNGIVNVSYSNNFADISYNFYNQLGQLIATVAPEGVKKLITNIGAYAVKTSVPFINLYDYNVKGQLISASTPDGGTSKFVYRKDGSLRFSQNAKQNAAVPKSFSYTNYDQYGRPVESGEYTGTITFTNDMSVTGPMQSILENISSNGGLTGGTQTDVVRTKYDVADNTHGLTGLGYVQDDYYLGGGVSMTEKYSKIVNNVPAAADVISRTWYNYDEEGKVTWTIKYINSPNFGYKTTNFYYDGVGHLTKTIFQKNTSTETFVHYFSYDAANQQLWKIYTNTADNILNRKLQATYIYYLHGGLKRVELATNLQGIDYTYTLQGALKSINNSNKIADPGQDGTVNSFGADVYGMVLDYFPGDYTNSRTTGVQAVKGVNTGAVITAANESYAGNIKAMTWFTQKNPAWINETSTPITNVYKYDSKYQFTESVWGTGLNFSAASATFNTTTFNSESVYVSPPTNQTPAYDANGNILNLQRTNGLGAQTDKFAYNYLPNTNKLSSVVNTAGATQTYGSYTYDPNGQMVIETTTDPSNQVKYLNYDVAGKVTVISRSAGPAFSQKVAEYVYDEMGTRIMKKEYNTANPSQLVKITYYVGGAVYTQAITGGTTYSTVSAIEYSIQGASGRLGTFYPGTTPIYAYNLTDHLGTVRAVVTVNGSNPEMRLYTDYYPFGMTIQTAGTQGRYDYQGNYAEKDPETKWNAFELRMYDSRIGRWLQFDPKNIGNSPYISMDNDPINKIDPDGGSTFSTDVIRNSDGSYQVVDSHPYDGDNNVYVVDNINHQRTGEIIGFTHFPWSFANANNKTGEFSGHANITFRLENLFDATSLVKKYTDAWYSSAFGKLSAGNIATLAAVSINGGTFDLKVHYPVENNKNPFYPYMYEGAITTIREIGNIVFGMNMRITNQVSIDQIFVSKESFYNSVMPVVGFFNQKHNAGNGYNSGYPYFGEHSYSGSNIFYGYFGKKY